MFRKCSCGPADLPTEFCGPHSCGPLISPVMAEAGELIKHPASADASAQARAVRCVAASLQHPESPSRKHLKIPVVPIIVVPLFLWRTVIPEDKVQGLCSSRWLGGGFCLERQVAVRERIFPRIKTMLPLLPSLSPLSRLALRRQHSLVRRFLRRIVLSRAPRRS